MNFIRGGLLAMLFALVSAPVLAAADSPVGTWRSIDDKTKKERSIIRITDHSGELQGVVEKIFDQPGDDPAHLCEECKGERKDKPVMGMTILWGLKKDGNAWAGGFGLLLLWWRRDRRGQRLSARPETR